MIRRLLAALAVTTALAGAAQADSYLCSPEVSGAAAGPRQVYNQNSSNPTRYQLNGVGCAMFLSADVGYFMAQGFTPAQAGGSVSVGPLVLNSASPSVWLPARSYITNILVANYGVPQAGVAPGGNVSGNGLRIGTTQTGTDIVNLISASALDAAWALQENSITVTSELNNAATQMVPRSVSPTAVINPAKRTFINPQQIFIDTPGAWGSKVSDIPISASATVTIFYTQF